MELTDLTWPAVAALDRDTPVVFPVAALEQHGRHMPLFTDSILLGEVVRRVKQSPAAGKVLFAPLQWLGNSHHHLDFPGTLSASPRAYLDLMRMRMPDRLQYAIHLEPAAARLHCPPMTLLTLVENAVRHGIDPGEAGGRIDVDIWLRDGNCLMRVADTGVGLKNDTRGLGTGLSNLRERLKLAFGNDARLTLTGITPHGVCAEISIPVREKAAA